MKLVATLKTTEFRGERADSVEVVFEVLPEETVEQLWERIFNQKIGLQINPKIDSIVLKAIQKERP